MKLTIYQDPWLRMLIPVQAEQEKKLREQWFARHGMWFLPNWYQATREREKEWEQRQIDMGKK